MTENVQKKITWYHNLNKIAVKGNIVFAGSTFVQNFPIQELERNFCVEQNVYNRGISGLTIADFKESLSACIFDLEPSKIFLNIGEEDVNTVTFNEVMFVTEYLQIIKEIKKELPLARIYVIGLLPTVNGYKKINKALQHSVCGCGCEFIDFENVLLDSNSCLKKCYKSDCSAISPSAYVAILRDLKMFFRNRMMGFGDVWNMVENWS
ncbi:MAG: hypothetical protein BKP49_11350 [Treponema sp. CETP13]|nr:MAG: hypothetical protein BKP49_11350 [Treponema sp. CETP13]